MKKKGQHKSSVPAGADLICLSLLVVAEGYFFCLALTVAAALELGRGALAMTRPDERAEAEDVIDREELSLRLARLLPKAGE